MLPLSALYQYCCARRYKVQNQFDFTAQVAESHPDMCIVRVRRNHLVEDAMDEISRQFKKDLFKPLRVHFIGEEGIDAGGVKKEFFQLLVTELLCPDYGLLVRCCLCARRGIDAASAHVAASIPTLWLTLDSPCDSPLIMTFMLESVTSTTDYGLLVRCGLCARRGVDTDPLTHPVIMTFVLEVCRCRDIDLLVTELLCPDYGLLVRCGLCARRGIHAALCVHNTENFMCIGGGTGVLADIHES